MLSLIKNYYWFQRLFSGKPEGLKEGTSRRLALGKIITTYLAPRGRKQLTIF
jgi:hypothetical protein